MKAKTFFEENSQGQMLHRTGAFSEFYDDVRSQGFYAWNEMTDLFFSSDVRARKERFGKQDFCTYDSERRRLWVWRIDLPTGTIWILTGGRGRGTSYEFMLADGGKLNQLVIEMIEFIMKDRL